MFYDGHKRMDARFLSLDYLESPINTTSACDAETVMFNRFHQQKSLHFHSSTSLEASKVFEFCSKFYFLGTNVLNFFKHVFSTRSFKTFHLLHSKTSWKVTLGHQLHHQYKRRPRWTYVRRRNALEDP